MKKHFYSLFAAASVMLAVTSCSQEEDFAQQSSSEKTTFSVSLEGIAGSRAVGDGSKVNQLYYAVYDKETEKVLYPVSAKYGVADKVNDGWTLELPLMKSETYDILFWAQTAGTGAYTIDELTAIKVNYDNVLSNKEDRDAFFNALDNFVPSGNEPHIVVLRRPFAQLNIATSKTDWDDAVAIYNSSNNTTGVAPVSESTVTVSSLAQKFNVLKGTATEPTEDVVVFKDNILIDESISVKRTVDGVEKDVEYKLLAMNYLLPIGTKAPNGVDEYNAAQGKDNVEVEFTLYKGQKEQIVNVKVPSTPIQRNWRTNIIGDLLTGEGFEIVIDANFDNTINQEIEIAADGIVKDAEGNFHITSKEGLYSFANLVNFQSAISEGRAATDYTFDNKTFILDCDIDLEGVEWTPIGSPSSKFCGTFDGNGKTIKNFKVTEKEGYVGLFGYIHVGEVKNLTVTDVTLKAYHYAGAIVGQGYVNIDNCHVENVIIDLAIDTNADNGKGDFGDKAGGIIGQNCEGGLYVKNSSAKNVIITGYRDLGGIVGMAQYGNTVSGNTVENITIVQDITDAYKDEIPTTLGAFVGRRGVSGSSTVTEENNSGEESVKIIKMADEEYPGYYADNGNYYATADEGIETLLKNDDFWADKTEVSVILKSDLTVDITAWDADQNPQVFGNAQTETITIDLQGNTLTFEQLNSDWNNIAANNAKLIIKNGHITSSGYNNGPWNRHDLNFACEVELIDITTDKAIALKNNGKLTNVTISDANTSDTYALWIQPKGQTVTLEGCTIDMLECTDGRGIKIDNQYVVGAENGEAGVTLNVSNTTFKTEEKSAIIVKTTLGADITLSNIDITGVQADNVCAVWVDSDAAASFDLVNVTGGKKALEGAGYYLDGGKYYATSDAGISALIGKGQTEINLADGSFKMPNVLAGKTLTFAGSRNAELDLTPVQDSQNTGANLTFNGITVKYGNALYKGLKHTNSVTYNDCAINGLQFLYAPTTFTNCDLNSNGAEHCVWTYGADEVSFTGCTFTYADRAVNCYTEQSSQATKVTFTDCTFTKVAGKATSGAIETNSSAMTGLELNINNCSVNEGDLWWVSEWDSKKGEKTIVTIDGKRVVATPAQLNVALADAKEGLEIYLGKGEFGTILAKSNKTIIGTDNAKVDCVNLNGAANLTLKDIKFDAATAVLGYDKSNARAYANIISSDKAGSTPSIGARGLVIDNCTFGGTFDATTDKFHVAIAFTDRSRPTGGSCDVTIKNCTFNTSKGDYDIYGYYTGGNAGSFKIENNKFNSEGSKPVFLGRLKSSEAVVVKGNGFKTVSSLSDAVTVSGDSGYSPTIDASNNTFAAANE